MVTKDQQGPSTKRLIEVSDKVSHEVSEPKSFTEAKNSDEAEQWKKAMDEEIDSLKKNHTEGKSVIGCKWVYKTKTDDHGQVVRYKACLVDQG